MELSSHIITLPMETGALLVRICEKWVDNEIHGIIRPSSLKIKELSSHIITLPMETDGFGRICENGSIMKSMAMRQLLVRICENGSIMKSMAMVDFFIENKGTFFPYHYITYGNRPRLFHYPCENGSIMKSMAIIGLLH
ncbi:hypothetical protein H6P81_021642 [Aristolochia fimbriata]|uniref:Uncharacterized protein n=1 Tax=Aristolochia fimbriata TaxID=158543 RepID=A0AAV7DPE2_ARIFI|nr:hypothetical protein H6P81_021642 [Aristolochia fimbriata]